MKNNPPSTRPARVDSREPRVHVQEGLPTNNLVRRPLVLIVRAAITTATALILVFLAGAAFTFGVAVGTRWLQ